MNEILNQPNLPAVVFKSETPVLLSFFAPRCTPSRMLSTVLDEISDQYDGSVRVHRVNADNEAALAYRYGVIELPTVIIFKNGQPAQRFSGIRREEEITNMIEKILQN